MSNSDTIIENFENILNEFPSLKPPGVSGARIKKLTELIIKNNNLYIQLIDKLYSHCNNINQSHKLGALYLLDSISRAFQNQISKNSNSISNLNYSNALNKLRSFVPDLLDSTLLNLSNDSTDSNDSTQKEKIHKLIKIWQKSKTFDNSTLQNIINKYYNNTNNDNTIPTNNTSTKFKSIISSSSANNTLNSAPPSSENNSNPLDLLKSLASLANKPQPPIKSPSPPLNLPLNTPPTTNSILNSFNSPTKLFKSSQNSRGRRMGRLDNNNNMNSMNNMNNMSNMNNTNNMSNRFNHHDRSRSPNMNRNLYRNDRSGRNDSFNSRLPSKDRNVNNKLLTQPQGHVVGELNTPGTAHYRERNVSFDPRLPSGLIKVLSRTVFIGGVPPSMNEKGLADILRPYAEVQSVILNSERKHAFVKVYSRKEAENVLASFSKNSNPNLSLRTRWGVGFGPRDCCDYQHGVSIIPLARLTDADKRWMVKAQWGGTGGKELVPGVVVEEPDIEVGAGLSSKAISKKMPTNGSRNGPRSTKPGEPDDFYTDPFNNNTTVPLISNDSNPLANLFSNSNANSQTNSQMSPQNSQVSALLSTLSSMMPQQSTQ
ncbi:Nrd1 complex RNA-binding subunit ASCRUDRAFT_31321 [Ascoidea rubescens DSM 1968]|uniref:RNA-binding domain-containing protein n=1 Tax=Ascoidea rubescens DSM 1968 TaxID=1344418 RepID=A0A1D2VMM4_9ASCO|nr:hypothetical protein ASCRUDRAFT_31321 [Ascoidea rubescens DSM 1968]ODV62862.1 hypothetical protein ASCRUDRAFT_31321 [Ascoidea rubescens DSM 1968]